MTRRRIVVVGLAIALAASLSANVLLGSALYRAFAELQEGRLFPLGRVPWSQQAGGATAHVALAIYGDSRALAWGTSLQAVPGLAVANLARGGDTSAQLRLRLASDRRPRSDWALLQIGINDLHPLGALPGQGAEIRKRLFENVDAIVEELRRTSACVVVSTVPPPGPVPMERRPVWDPSTLAALAELNDRLRAKAGTRGVLVFDAARLLAGTSGELPRPYVDRDFFLHFTAGAYRRLDDALLGRGSESDARDAWARGGPGSADPACAPLAAAVTTP